MSETPVIACRGLRKVFVHLGPVGTEELSYLLAGERPPVLGRR